MSKLRLHKNFTPISIDDGTPAAPPAEALETETAASDGGKKSAKANMAQFLSNKSGKTKSATGGPATPGKPAAQAKSHYRPKK